MIAGIPNMGVYVRSSQKTTFFDLLYFVLDFLHIITCENCIINTQWGEIVKFFVGYQQRRTPAFIEEVVRQREHIREFYFSWGGYANGRNSQLQQAGLTPWEAQAQQERDLQTVSDAGIPLNVLFNAMCYGKHSQSRTFFEGIGETVDYLQSRYNLTSVTTTSLLIAKFLKSNFPELDIRASVNMSIETVEGFDYVKDYFDSFYAARECNRDFTRLSQLKAWCDQNGKTLYGLANSGCLNHCSAHVFHDNLVAHEAEIAEMDNGFGFEGVCRQYLSDPQHRGAFVDNMSYIRPEDIPLYEDLFSAVKLATRVNPDPVRVLRAYTEGKHNGSLLDLLEPNHAGLLYPHVIENSRIISRVVDGKLQYTGLEDATIFLEGFSYVDQ